MHDNQSNILVQGVHMIGVMLHASGGDKFCPRLRTFGPSLWGYSGFLEGGAAEPAVRHKSGRDTFPEESDNALEGRFISPGNSSFFYLVSNPCRRRMCGRLIPY